MATSSIRILRQNNQNISSRDEGNVENVIIELKEKLSRLKFRFLDCQNKNQMLRKELLLARKVVNTELFRAPAENFKDVLEQSKSADFRGRREKILLLKEKLSELQNRIREIEEGHVEYRQADPPKKTKVYKNVEQKQLPFRQTVQKELKNVLENACQMKQKLELWKKRNVELGKEAELIRLELERLLEKSKEDQDVHISFKVTERELRARQLEKLDMRSKLQLEVTRNRKLSEELAILKGDLSLIVSKINDDKVLIDALNDQKGYLQDLLDRQKLILESDLRKFGSDLREVQTKHATNSNILSQLQDIVDEKNLIFQQLQTSAENKILIPEEKQQDDAVSSVPTATGSQEALASEPQKPAAPTDDGQSETETEPSAIDVEIANLKEECEQHKSLFRSCQDEVQRLTGVIKSNNKRLNEWLAQLLQTRSLYAQKNAEVRDLEETLKRHQKSLSSKSKDTNSPKLYQASSDEMIKMSDVLNEEYQFLYFLWCMLMTDKENSLEIFIGYVDYIKKIFVEDAHTLLQTSNEDSNAAAKEEQSEIPADN